jgi:OOP family OmpA-OmpF porin
MDLIVAPVLAGLAYLMIQNTTTLDQVVLLPDANGNVGEVVINTRNSEHVLNSAYAAARTNGLLRVLPVSSEGLAVRQRYAEVLNALPPRPVSFTVYFATGSDSELTPESLPIIEQMKSVLLERPAPEITVIGHTDTVGSPAINDALSLARAATVQGLLVAANLQAVSLDVAGRGERELLIPTGDEVAEEKNRRVEIHIR